MSVRVYRVKNIVTAKRPTFNLWYDTELVNKLYATGYMNTLRNGGGLFEISVEELKEILSEVQIEKGTRDTIQKDIEWAEAKGEDYITYYCY
ncbi:MAG: hypothetical protein ACK4WF_03300 [Candidatus Brocadiales bacterium]